jgi:hypothetical protein
MVILMPPFLRLLRWLGMGKQIREDGPGTHLVKQGTPTMGGVLIVFVTLALRPSSTPMTPRPTHRSSSWPWSARSGRSTTTSTPGPVSASAAATRSCGS